jgi:hypothetical protein
MGLDEFIMWVRRVYEKSVVGLRDAEPMQY